MKKIKVIYEDKTTNEFTTEVDDFQSILEMIYSLTLSDNKIVGFEVKTIGKVKRL